MHWELRTRPKAMAFKHKALMEVAVAGSDGMETVRLTVEYDNAATVVSVLRQLGTDHETLHDLAANLACDCGGDQ